MRNNTIVSFADNKDVFRQTLKRLLESLDFVKFKGRIFPFTEYSDIQSPPHLGDGSIPYAFKSYAITKAISKGAEVILWCDSSIYAVKDLSPIFDHIKREGYIFFDNVGFSIGEYTSDACLEQHGMSRDEAYNSKMIMACVMGFDIRNQKAIDFLTRYFEASTDGVSYQGAWNNDNLCVSKDKKCKGHRHDQSVASIIIKQQGLTITNAQSTYLAYTSHQGVMPIATSVSLWANGQL